MKDERPDFMGANSGGIGGGALGAEEPLKIAYAACHNIYGVSALALGLGAEAVALNEAAKLCCNF